MIGTKAYYLYQYQIDKQKYDECVKQAVNSLIYAHSFYLDNLCPKWDALVAEDYSWVMPVTWNKKWSTKYLYQPPFAQQLGVFQKENAIVPWEDVIDILRRRFWFWEINFNYLCRRQFDRNSFNAFTCTNYILDLTKDYSTLSANYHKDLLKNLKRSRKFTINYRGVIGYQRAIDEYINHYSERMTHVNADDYNNFRDVCRIASERGMIVCREVVNDKNELLAIILLLNDGKRLYNIMNTTTAAGRRLEANHFLLDAVIKEFAGIDMILDFEGSDLVGVRSFYENFGATNQSYFMVRYNNLPWPLRLLK